ncbi:MAG: hypothetical protein KYX64_06390 [Sphingopyxis sp.]|nr:hypothetical protein [Sphingopyxis sp.]
MRFGRQLFHLLIGLLAFALLAAAASWMWPEDSSRIWFFAYAAMGGAAFWELAKMFRDRNGEQGDNCG